MISVRLHELLSSCVSTKFLPLSELLTVPTSWIEQSSAAPRVVIFKDDCSSISSGVEIIALVDSILNLALDDCTAGGGVFMYCCNPEVGFLDVAAGLNTSR